MTRFGLALAAAALGALVTLVPAARAQAPIEGELVLITPVSKFIHDAALKAFADYAKEKWNSAYASLSLVHPSMEEAAASVGATGLRSFRDITLPLIWKGVLVGSLFSFMTSLQEASAVLFLALGGWESILVAAATTAVVNWIADARMGGVFG